MSSSAAVAISAATLASVEDGKQRDECRDLMSGFRHNEATVEDARQYADCVDLLHPDPMTGSEIFVIKVFIVWALLGAVLNMIAQRQQVYGVFDWVMFAFFGAAGGALVPASYYLIKFLIAG